MYLAPLNYDRYFKKVFSDEAIAKAFLEDFLEVTIEALEMLPNRVRVTDEAAYVEFDFRCRIAGNYVIIDMQQWYKPDIVQRFYLYHALNSGLQLEGLPKEAFPLKRHVSLKKTEDYRKLEPVITLIWMADDSLGFEENYIAYVMAPELVLDFLKNERLWQNDEIRTLLDERERILTVVNNETKHLDFLPKNRLIFAFQKNIVKNKRATHYDRWFRFAEKTRESANTPEDFEEYKEDAVFSEIMRRLDASTLGEDDLQYIEQERELWSEVKRLEQGFYEDGRHDGRRELYREIILRNHVQGKSLEQIVEITGLDRRDVQRILSQYKEQT